MNMLHVYVSFVNIVAAGCRLLAVSENYYLPRLATCRYGQCVPHSMDLLRVCSQRYFLSLLHVAGGTTKQPGQNDGRQNEPG